MGGEARAVAGTELLKQVHQSIGRSVAGASPALLHLPVGDRVGMSALLASWVQAGYEAGPLSVDASLRRDSNSATGGFISAPIG